MRKGPGSAYDKWNISVVSTKIMYVSLIIVFICESVWPYWVEANQCRFSYVLFISVLPCEDPIIKMVMVRAQWSSYNDLQNTLQKTKDQWTRTPRKTRGELMCSGRVGNGTRRVNLVTKRTLWRPDQEWSRTE
jgi:hypothetical protein